MVFQSGAPSAGTLVDLDLAFQRWVKFGSISAKYRLRYNDYFSAHQYDPIIHDLEFPIAVRVGPFEDLVLRPFTGYSQLGTQRYHELLGVGVSGVIKKSVLDEGSQHSGLQALRQIGGPELVVHRVAP